MTEEEPQPRPRLLLVTHGLGGGTERHVDDLVDLLSPLVDVDVLRPVDPVTVSLDEISGRTALLNASDWFAVVRLLQTRSYSRLHVHHVHGYPAEILELPSQLGLPYDLTLHDFYPFCPQYSLTTVEGEYCGEPDIASCAACLNVRTHAWGWSIDAWRQSMGDFLANAARIIAPSHFLAERIERRFPSISIEVCPHPPRAQWLSPQTAPKKILLLGGLTVAKGLETLLACAADARDRTLPLAFRLLGYPEKGVPQYPDLPIQISGEYVDADLPNLVSLERCDAVWFPGRIPESYSYTLDVALDSELAILATDIGAIAERLAQVERATLLPLETPPSVWNDTLIEIAGGVQSTEPCQPGYLDAGSKRLREAYREYLSAPLSELDISLLHSPVALEQASETMAPVQPAPARELSLAALYEHGVVCGHRDTRLALKQRLSEVEKDNKVLDDYSDRFGKPWYEALNEAAENEARLQRDVSSLIQQRTGDQRLLEEHNRQRAADQQSLEEYNRQRAVDQQLREELIRQRAADQQSLEEHNRQRAVDQQVIEELIRQRAEDQRLIQEQRQQLADDEHMLGVERQVIEALRSEKRAFELSTSWKVTAPLRGVSILSRHLRTQGGRLRHGVGRRAADSEATLQPASPSPSESSDHDQLAATSEAAFQPDNPSLLEPSDHDQLTSISVAKLPPIGHLSLDTCPDGVVPRVSIVIPVHGQHQHTFNCLCSLGQHTDLNDVEVIVVDDASPEPAALALHQVEGVRFIANAMNLGFIGSCHHGVALARGDYLVLLNNDIEVSAGWLQALLDVFRLRPDAGLVGARLINPDGTLQEAGGIVWQDGSAWNWGRGQDPDSPAYSYLRAADYCSGACLAMRIADWKDLDGFDRVYEPAYYEDTDLAFRIRAVGKRVYYQPRATIIHYEGVTSGTDETQGVKQYQVINQKTFFERWRSVLRKHQSNGVAPRLEADRGARARVLIVEACFITPDQDSGSVRMQAILELLVELGCKVSFVADNLECREPYADRLRQLGVEVWCHPYIETVDELLAQHGSEYDMVVFCRHYIADCYIQSVRRWAPNAKIVFDTVDLHYLREQREAELKQSPELQAAAARTRAQELYVIAKADVTLVVSPIEQDLLARELPGSKVEILSNIHEPQPPGKPFAARQGLLFVGGFRHTPNVDAMEWFVGQVWPLLRRELTDIELTIVGSHMPDSIRSLEQPGINVLGFVEDLNSLLESTRIALAPMRYGAGVKGKINQALAWGVPVVATSVSAEGMQLEHEKELLIADTPEDFASAIRRLYVDDSLWNQLADAGRRNVQRHFSRAVAKAELARLLGLEAMPKVDVIVPVYGQEALVRACIESVYEASCKLPYELVVIDDASPEAGLSSWLDGQSRAGRLTLLKQAENRGFVAAVNRGMSLHTDRDIVLLNSDTRVSGNWLDRLYTASRSRERVATVTPFSNNATICSYPDYPQGGPLPDGWSVQRLDRLCASVCPQETVQIPTAVGFCMYISRLALKQVGFFDEKAFGRGYGEENDFCMLASQEGNVHLLAADTYVYHAGGVSFDETAEALKRNAQAVIERRWPDYNRMISEFIAADPIRPLRERLERARERG